jgi:hypothetical protein
MREQLSALIRKFDGGKVCMMAARNHPDFDREIQERVAKQVEAEIALRTQPRDDGEGNIYEGAWVNGKKNGFGKQKFKSGSLYEGLWKDGKRNGLGKLTVHNGDTY